MRHGSPSDDLAIRLAYLCVGGVISTPQSQRLSLNRHVVWYGNDTVLSVFSVFGILIVRLFPCFLKILVHDTRCRCPNVIAHDI